MRWRVIMFVLIQTANFLFADMSYGQNYFSSTQFKLNQLSTEQGLSQGNIYKIYRDRDGFIWVASEDGLNRFDGYDFRVFKHNQEDGTSISDNIIWSILEDREGVLWVGTNQGGLCRYNKEYANFRRYIHDPDNPKSISQNTVKAIFEASDGKMWIGTHWGLNIFDRQEEVFKSFFAGTNASESGLLNNQVFSIIESDAGEIWVGTGSGISIYSLDGKHLRNLVDDKNGLVSEGEVTNMLKEENGNIWISVDGKGLYRYDATDENFTCYKQDPGDPNSLGNHFIRSLVVDTNGILWIGMDGYGFQVFDAETERFNRALQNSNIEPDQIEKVYELYNDSKGNYWFGSYGHGVFVLNRNGGNFTHFSRIYHDNNSLSNNSILAIKENSDGMIYLGTDGGGINVFNPKDQTFSHIRHDGHHPGSLSTDVVKSLLLDSKGNLWAGTFNFGMDVQWKGNKNFQNFNAKNSGLANDHVWALLEDKNQNVWIGTLGAGVRIFDHRTRKINPYKTLFEDDPTISSVNIAALLEDSEGKIWVGTIGHGVCVIDPETNRQKRYSSLETETTSLSHNEIRYLFESSKNEIWIGTTYGLNRFDRKSETFRRYFESDGLVNNVIKGIVEDEQGMFWISSNNGVFKFDPETGDVTRFNRSDGLQGREFNYNASIKASDGKIYFGGLNGFNQFDPRLVHSNDNQPGIIFTQFLLFNRPIPISENGPLKKEINRVDRLEFNYDEYIFTIEFAADEYYFPKRNQYQYKLEGFEPNWNDVGQSRSATYTNLPPGEYTFMVRASNNSGVWSNKTRKLAIVVNPPWWHTRWAYFLFALTLIMIVIVIVRIRTSYLHAQKIRLKSLVRKRTRELEEKNEQITAQAEELNVFNDTLNAVNENLEKKVIERTNELLDKNKKLSDYAFLNAHNLRAPVANIKGLVQLFEFKLSMQEKEEIITQLQIQVEKVDAVLLDINQRLKEDGEVSSDVLEKDNQSRVSSSASNSSS